MWSNQRVAVTGAQGFVGSHLVDLLESQGANVLCVDVKNGHDLTSYMQMEELLDGVDLVFHLATLSLPLSLKKPYKVGLNIYMMSLVLAELCAKKFIKRIVQISSSEAYGSAKYEPMDEQHPLNPTTPYGGGKAAADIILQSYARCFKVPHVIIRPFNMYGPRQSLEFAGIIPAMIQKMMKNEDIVLNGDGTQTRDFLYVKDAVKAMVDLSGNSGLINIASGSSIMIKDLVYMIARLMKYDKEIKFGQPRQGEVQTHTADITKAKELGFTTKYTLEEGLKETIQWYRKEVIK